MKKELIDVLWTNCKIKLDESSKNGSPKYIVSGPFMKADTPNLNNRIYSKEVANKAIDALRPKVKERLVKMLVDHPYYEPPSLLKTGAILLDITNIQDDGFAYYKAQITDTNAGKDLKAILDAGGKIGVSTRGYATVTYEKDVTDNTTEYEYIGDDFVLESIDFVDNPSVIDTTPNMTWENQNNNNQRRNEEMKTLDELKVKYPDLYKKIEENTKTIEKQLNEEKQNIEKQLNEFKSKVTSFLKETKEDFEDIFVVKSESKLVKEKEEVIESLNKKVKELQDEKDKQVKALKEAEIEKIKASDKEFFDIEQFKNVFDNCITADEVSQVYEHHKKLIEELKKNVNTSPKTKQDVSENDNDNDEEDAKLVKKLEGLNKTRLTIGLEPLTMEKFKKEYC